VKTSNTRETLSSFLDLCGIDSDIFHVRRVAAFRKLTWSESCIHVREWCASLEPQNAAIFVGFSLPGPGRQSMPIAEHIPNYAREYRYATHDRAPMRSQIRPSTEWVELQKTGVAPQASRSPLLRLAEGCRPAARRWSAWLREALP
jgi:hypothetical protein